MLSRWLVRAERVLEIRLEASAARVDDTVSGPDALVAAAYDLPTHGRGVRQDGAGRHDGASAAAPTDA